MIESSRSHRLPGHLSAAFLGVTLALFLLVAVAFAVRILDLGNVGPREGPGVISGTVTSSRPSTGPMP